VQVAGSRYYSPGLGRWTNRDPIGEKGGVNTYGIVRNSVTGLIDVLGQIPGVGRWFGRIPGVGRRFGHIPGVGRWYGNWCGGGYSDGRTDAERGDPPNPPINWNGPVFCPIDGACRDHDACYEMCKSGTNPRTGDTRPAGRTESECKADCNQALCRDLRDQGLPDEDCPGASVNVRLRAYRLIWGQFCNTPRS
jgi:hypothetical protein